MDGNFLQIDSAGWLTISAILQATWGFLMVLVTIYALLWAKRQVDEAKKAVDETKKARVLSAYLTFESRLWNDQARDERRFIYEHNFENPATMELAHREILERVCSTFDVLGVLVREDLMYRPLVFKPFYDVIIKCWLQALDFINFERSPSRKAQTYMQDFEYLYQEAEKYRLEHNFPPVTIHPPHADKTPIVPSPKKRAPIKGRTRPPLKHR
jgi:hypothetical protein